MLAISGHYTQIIKCDLILMQWNKYNHNPYLSCKIIYVPPISSSQINLMPCIRFHYSNNNGWDETSSWWHCQMETFSASLALCAGNSPVSVQSPSQRPVARSFDVFFDQRLNKRLSKQSRRRWFETRSFPLWRHSNVGLQTQLFISHLIYPISIDKTYSKVWCCL